MATPSLAMIPCGRKATKLYSVLPTDGTGDFTVARASQGSEINSDLKIQNVANNVPRFTYDTLGGCPSLLTEPQSTNLITYPVSFGNSYWTKSGATIEGDASTAGTNIVTGDFTSWATSGTSGVTATSFVFNAGGNWIRKNFSSTTGQTYKVTLIGTQTAGGVFNVNSYSGSGLGLPSITDASFSEVFYTDFISSSASAVMLQSISAVVNTVSFTTFTIEEVQGFSSPHVDYPTSAFKLVEDTSTGEHRILSANMPATTIGLYYSQSIRVKYIDTQYVSFTSGNLTKWNAGSVFDLVNGTVSNVEGGTSKIEALADGWYEISISGIVLVSDALTLMFLLSNSSTTNRPSYTGNGTSSVYIFGGQAEQQPVATSFIYNGTEGATVTRVAEICNQTPPSGIIGQTEGTIFLNIKRGVQINNTQGLFGISSPSGDNRIIIWNIFTLNSLGIQIKANNANVITSQSLGVFNNGENYKIAVSYKSGEIKGYVNGLQIFNLTNTFTFTSALSEIYLNNYANNSFTEISPINELQIYNTALSDAELQALTSN